MTLADIVERARNDALPLDQQHAAFAELVRRFEESASRWALQLLDDPEEARDAAQDAFLTAWRKLRQLRDPAAFGAWLKRLVATQCNRRRRKVNLTTYESGGCGRRTPEYEEVTDAIARLSEPHHRVVVLFYFLGRKIDEIAAILGIPRGTVGKRLHDARIALRRNIPRVVRPSAQFQRQVMEGLFDEYVGEYRFAERPDLLVKIAREEGELISYGGDQRSVLASMKEGALLATAFDGEGRFERDRAGRIARFVYYEFGARLGVAKKVSAEFASASSSL